MSRRIKRTQSRGDRRPERPRNDFRKSERPAGYRPGGKPPRFAEARGERPDKWKEFAPESTVKAESALPTKVQTVTVMPDEDNMRVDRFLEARFPGLSFSHIQRIVRKGELRVNGK